MSIKHFCDGCGNEITYEQAKPVQTVVAHSGELHLLLQTTAMGNLCICTACLVAMVQTLAARFVELSKHTTE